MVEAIHTGQEPQASYLSATRGISSWLFSLDHKRVGLMYLLGIMLSFLLGGIFALLIRTELIGQGPVVTDDAATYARMFTAHGTIMVFLVLIPSIPATLGNFFLPLIVGAKDMAFPKLNLAGLWFYLIGVVFFLGILASGQLENGWTFYAGYSNDTETGVILATAGAFILGLSSVFTGINFLVTIQRKRAAGMSWDRLPLFAWSLYVTSLVQVLATPVIGVTLALLLLESATGMAIFNPDLGGDPVLLQHFFWFYSHPVVYVMVLPAFGVIAEVIATHSRKAVFGYKAIAGSFIAIAFLGFLVWGNQMSGSSESFTTSVIFSFLTMALVVPTVIVLFSLIATMYRGSVRFTTPMVWALVFLVLVSIGGATGVFMGSPAVAAYLQDTYFAVAHFHFTMQGGVLIGFIAGIFHWWPKMTGREYCEKMGSLSALLVLVGFLLTFVTQLVMGARGMPRRYYVVPEEFQTFHTLSTVGSYILAVGLFLAAGVLLMSLFKGKKVSESPWTGTTFEWQAATPPARFNFASEPVCTGSPYRFPEIEGSGGSNN